VLRPLIETRKEPAGSRRDDTSFVILASEALDPLSVLKPHDSNELNFAVMRSLEQLNINEAWNTAPPDTHEDFLSK
jgi:hypothetical protein